MRFAPVVGRVVARRADCEAGYALRAFIVHVCLRFLSSGVMFGMGRLWLPVRCLGFSVASVGVDEGKGCFSGSRSLRVSALFGGVVAILTKWLFGFKFRRFTNAF